MLVSALPFSGIVHVLQTLSNYANVLVYHMYIHSFCVYTDLYAHVTTTLFGFHIQCFM